MHEVESVCDQVTLIDKGVTQFNGDVADFRAIGNGNDLYSSFLALVDEPSSQPEQSDIKQQAFVGA